MNFRKEIDKLKVSWGTTPLVLITGGSSGMGLHYAHRLAEAGCNLLLVSNQEAELEKVSRELSSRYGVSVEARFQDLATDDAADDLFAFCEDRHLEVDILINNAGMFFFEELSPANQDKAMVMLRLHTFAPTRLSLLFGNAMKKRGRGFIVIVSSMAATFPMPGITIYSATKAYLKSFGKSLYFEMHPYGVGVTTVCPAAIATPLYRLKESLLKLGVRIGLIGTPQWLVRKALRGMFRRKRVVKPGLMNVYLPPLIALLPIWLVNYIWKKVK